MFVRPFRFVAPLFVNEVKELVPLRIFETAVVVAYVLEAAVVVKYDDNELLKAYELRADESAYELRVLVRLLLVTYEPNVDARADVVT